MRQGAKDNIWSFASRKQHWEGQLHRIASLAFIFRSRNLYESLFKNVFLLGLLPTIFHYNVDKKAVVSLFFCLLGHLRFPRPNSMTVTQAQRSK